MAWNERVLAALEALAESQPRVIVPQAITAGVAVLVTSTVILAADTARTALIVQNNGAYPVWLNLAGAAAVAGSGVCLYPNGDRLSFSRDAVPLSEIRGIAVGGTSAVVTQAFH
ncbi:MAG TPA: hypothetical protein VMY35_02775 [Phycisphaerae bacterium]|nr:hypothetical protein [Phycisphaerae bacterium]